MAERVGGVGKTWEVCTEEGEGTEDAQAHNGDEEGGKDCQQPMRMCW